MPLGEMAVLLSLVGCADYAPMDRFGEGLAVRRIIEHSFGSVQSRAAYDLKCENGADLEKVGGSSFKARCKNEDGRIVSATYKCEGENNDVCVRTEP